MPQVVAGGGTGTAITYDVRFGTDAVTAAATGWFTFDLRPGCRRIWVDSSMANDTGNGLTAATAKKTLMAAWTVFTNGSWTPGDQLMLAGTGSRSYTDDGSSVGWFNVASQTTLGATAATYPTAVLCYDPADAANSAKYGKLLGQERPRILMFDPTIAVGISIFSNATQGAFAEAGKHGGFAVQGIILDGQNIDANGVGTTQRHDYLCWQNCLFIQLNVGNTGRADDKSSTINYSKSAFYAPWRAFNGNTSCMFNDDIDGMWVQDCVIVHGGWKLGASRDDSTADGGTSVFGHGSYYAAGNLNGHFDRIVTVDNASDGINLRGFAAATQMVELDEPIQSALTGYSTSYLDQPLGSIVTIDDFASIGASNVWSTSAAATKGTSAHGWGFSAINAQPGTHLNNGVMFDSPFHADAGNFAVAITRADNHQITEQVNVTNLRTHNWSTVYSQSRAYLVGQASTVSIIWSNCLLDTLAGVEVEVGGGQPDTTISGTGVRTWTGGDYPNALTKDDVVTAMGFSSKAAMVNAMLEYPHLAWAQAILGIVFTGYGATAQYATATAPDISALPAPTVVYKTTLSNLTISTLAFVHNVASTALLSGCSANFALTSSDLPSGFSIIGRRLIYAGSGASASTPMIHVLETNSDGAGTHTTAFTLSIT